MLTKALSSIAVPRLSSETKTKISQPRYQRATILPRSAAVSRNIRAKAGSFVPYLTVATLALVLFLIGFHLVMVNTYVSKGVELKKHQQALRDLDDQNKALLVQQSEMGSISKVNDVANFYGLVPVTNEEFLNTSQLTQK